MLRLRPYKKCDAETIVRWIRDERTQRRWSGGRYEHFPITAEDMNYRYLEINDETPEPDNHYPMTAFDESGPVGHLVLRYMDEERTVVRFWYVIIDDAKRGKGYGKEMLRMALKYSFEMLGAQKVTLGVFDSNVYARRCYTALGFREVPLPERRFREYLGETWESLEMEITREEFERE